MRVTSWTHGAAKLAIASMACLAFSGLANAQGRGGAAPAPPPINLSKNPLLQGFAFRSIGPGRNDGPRG